MDGMEKFFRDEEFKAIHNAHDRPWKDMAVKEYVRLYGKVTLRKIRLRKRTIGYFLFIEGLHIVVLSKFEYEELRKTVQKFKIHTK